MCVGIAGWFRDESLEWLAELPFGGFISGPINIVIGIKEIVRSIFIAFLVVPFVSNRPWTDSYEELFNGIGHIATGVFDLLPGTFLLRRHNHVDSYGIQGSKLVIIISFLASGIITPISGAITLLNRVPRYFWKLHLLKKLSKKHLRSINELNNKMVECTADVNGKNYLDKQVQYTTSAELKELHQSIAKLKSNFWIQHEITRSTNEIIQLRNELRNEKAIILVSALSLFAHFSLVCVLSKMDRIIHDSPREQLKEYRWDNRFDKTPQARFKLFENAKLLPLYFHINQTQKNIQTLSNLHLVIRKLQRKNEAEIKVKGARMHPIEERICQCLGFQHKDLKFAVA